MACGLGRLSHTVSSSPSPLLQSAVAHLFQASQCSASAHHVHTFRPFPQPRYKCTATEKALCLSSSAHGENFSRILFTALPFLPLGLDRWWLLLPPIRTIFLPICIFYLPPLMYPLISISEYHSPLSHPSHNLTPLFR